MSEKKLKWTRLDNASKIFPPTITNRDSKVFRLSCELNEPVVEEVLQEALNRAIKEFPHYQNILRRGFFWYYFEQSELMPEVTKESLPLCAPLYFKGEKTLLFRVFYFENFIRAEIFHSLSDGAGAIWFFETLIDDYFLILRERQGGEALPPLVSKASMSQKIDDSFEKVYDEKRVNSGASSKHKGKVYQIKGSKVDENKTKLIEGTLSVKEALALSHEYDATLTIFLTALLIYAIYQEMPEKSKSLPVVIQVPINLRPYYDSQTARNFFATMNILHNLKTDGHELEDIILSVKRSYKEELTMDKLNDHLHELMALEKNPFARLIPLPIKNLTLKFFNHIRGAKVTSSLSNVGRIKVRDEFKHRVVGFSTSVSSRRPQIIVTSYEDKLAISFTSPYEDTELQRIFFKFFTDHNINLVISSNL